MNPTSPDAAARLASALALVTTLTAAAETTAAIAARRRGDLPSGTRARADVRADLDAARADADALLRQVARSALVVDAASLNRGVRMASLAFALQRLGRRLHALHQHLLGLYAPTARETGDAEMDDARIDEGLIEDVRVLAAQAAALLDGAPDAADGPALAAFAGRGLRVLARVPTGAALR